jgi:hypothetical protein
MLQMNYAIHQYTEYIFMSNTFSDRAACRFTDFKKHPCNLYLNSFSLPLLMKERVSGNQWDSS